MPSTPSTIESTERLEHLRRQADRMAELEEKIAALEHERSALRASTCDLEWRLQQYQAIKDEWDWFFANSLDMLIVHNDDGSLKRVNPAVKSVLGYEPDEFMGMALHDVMHPDDLERTIAHIREIAGGIDGLNFESRVKHKDGSWRWLSWTTPAPDKSSGSGRPAFAVARDITEQKLTQQELLYRAQHDSLTGLANRALLEQAVRHTLVRSERSPDASVCLMLIDLDGFKAVNDTHGHTAGDEVLRAVATRLVQACRKGDVVARLGGDEFACLLEGADPAAVDGIAARMLELVGQAIPFGDAVTRVGCSIGIASYPSRAHDLASLFDQADKAMYGVKARGKRAFARYA